jgi:hypothetical protein
MATMKSGKPVARRSEPGAFGVAVGRGGFVVEEALKKMTHEHENWLRGADARRRAQPGHSSESGSGSDIMKRRWNSSDMAICITSTICCATARVLLLDQLRKDAFKIGQAHQFGQISGRSVGQYLPLAITMTRLQTCSTTSSTCEM